MIFKYGKRQVQTAHNRIVCASPLKRLGVPFARSPKGSHAHSTTVCQPWSLLRKALIRAGKPSFTTGTLYAIYPKVDL